MINLLYPRLYNGVWNLVQRITHGQEFVILGQLKETQYYPVEKLREIQLERLKTLVSYSYENVPFYRQRFRDIGMLPGDIKSIEDYSKIPILTRKDIQENLPVLQSSIEQPGKHINYTGGSTGKPLAFYVDQMVHDNYKASLIRLRQWYGFHRGEKVAYIWGAERDIPQWSNSTRLLLSLKRQKWLNAFKMTDASLQKFSRDMQFWRPKFIVGYASAIHAVAKYLLQHDVSDIRPIAIESSAEKLWDFQRKDIERAFHAPVIDVYGSREISPIASQCLERDGLHVMAETRLVEITDNHGKPIESGQVVLTDLTNYSMPLIRYANGDMASWRGGNCQCGRTLPLLDQIQGRTSDLIWTKSGTIIHGEFFTHLFYGQPITQFQVRQVALEKLIIYVCPAEGFSNKIFSQIESRTNEFSGEVFDIEFVVVDQIPLTQSGKYRFTISEIS